MGDMADDYADLEFKQSRPYSEWNPHGYKVKKDSPTSSKLDLDQILENYREEVDSQMLPHTNDDLDTLQSQANQKYIEAEKTEALNQIIDWVEREFVTLGEETGKSYGSVLRKEGRDMLRSWQRDKLDSLRAKVGRK